MKVEIMNTCTVCSSGVWGGLLEEAEVRVQSPVEEPC